jgi:putative ABC transport system permease protein
VRRFSGRYRSSLIIGLQGIRARKLRTFLSMISLFLGVLAVVVVQAGAETAHRALLSNIELVDGKDGSRMLLIPPGPTSIPVTFDTLRGRTDAVAFIGGQAIIGEPGVSPVNAGGVPFDQMNGGRGGGRFNGPDFGGPGGPIVNCDSSGACSLEMPDSSADSPPPGQAIELNLVAMTGDIRQFRPYRPVAGQWLDFSSPPSLAPRLVLNKEAAKGFARYRVPAEMRLAGGTTHPTPRIIGVVDDGSDGPTAYLRADELMNWVPPAALGQNGALQVLASPAADATLQILRARLAAGGIPPGQLHLETIDSKKHIAQQLALIRWVFLGMAGLVLLIGVAGILNVGLATVGERIEEFALRRAVGTPRSLLAAIVLAETLITGLLTAAAAIGVAAVALRVTGGFLASHEPSLRNLQFPWQAGVAGIIAGLVAGLLGGFVPALRAARIPIATIMRA